MGNDWHGTCTSLYRYDVPGMLLRSVEWCTFSWDPRCGSQSFGCRDSPSLPERCLFRMMQAMSIFNEFSAVPCPAHVAVSFDSAILTRPTHVPDEIFTGVWFSEFFCTAMPLSVFHTLAANT